MGVMDVIRQALLDARTYRAEWDAYESLSASARRDVIPPRRDLKLDALAGVVDGTTLVHAHAYRADETLQLSLSHRLEHPGRSRDTRLPMR